MLLWQHVQILIRSNQKLDCLSRKIHHEEVKPYEWMLATRGQQFQWLRLGFKLKPPPKWMVQLFTSAATLGKPETIVFSIYHDVKEVPANVPSSQFWECYLYIYTYIYIYYIYVCVCMCINIYIYICIQVHVVTLSFLAASVWMFNTRCLLET